jgi:hypothetical protein
VVCICQVAIFQTLSSSVTRFKSQNTKLHEFKFRAVLDDGVREARFERMMVELTTL